MTISILAIDRKTGVMGGAAATGSLCVGGWVLRGDAGAGLSASQGSLPSTLWGTEVLDRMRDGVPADDAVRATTQPDPGRAQRQLSALNPGGSVGHFTGADSIAHAGAVTGDGIVVAGNMLASEAVLAAALDAMADLPAPLDARLLSALHAAEAAGGDSRGFQSAALLVVGRDRAPLTLRIDHADAPLAALDALHARATTGIYAEWAASVPTLDAPARDRLPDALSGP